MFIKRALALVAVLAIALSAAACGGSQDGGSSAGGGAQLGEKNNVSELAIDSDAVLATMPEELKGTTITFLNWYDLTCERKRLLSMSSSRKPALLLNTVLLNMPTMLTPFQVL